MMAMTTSSSIRVNPRRGWGAGGFMHDLPGAREREGARAPRPRPPRRHPDGHKGSYGRVLVVAGGRGMSGAAVLSGRAALRGGAGLVQVATPADVWPVVAAGDPCYLTAALPLHADGTYSESS